MQIGGASSLLGFNRDKELFKLSEVSAVQKVEREKFAQPEADKAAKNAQSFFENSSQGTSPAAQTRDIPANGEQVTLASSQTSQTLFYAQQIASTVPEATPVSQAEPKPSEHGDAVEAYRDIVGRTPGERMRAQVLRGLGLTEEQLEQLSPEERKKVEEQITQIIDEKVKSSVSENIAEQQGGPGENASNGALSGKGDTEIEKGVNAKAVGVSGNSVQNQEEEKSDELHKSLMKNMV